ncbi:MAG: ABC transporter permease [Thermoleophilia bacterium]|nr:ABC transporter permease [Thermoleophilia bacterium]
MGRREGVLTADIRSRFSAIGLAAPLGLVLLFLLVIPLGIGLWYSFRSGSLYGVSSSLTTQNYADVLARDTFWKAVRTSVVFGLATAGISVFVGFTIARYIRFEHRSWVRIAVPVVMLAVLGGYLVRIYAWRTILGDTGVINSALTTSGISDEPLGWLLFSPTAVILTLGSIYAPYATLIILSGLESVRDDEVEASRDLGATPFGVYRKVILPLVGRSILLSFCLIFLLSAADYVIPPLVGGPDTQMVGVLIANQFLATGDVPMGAAYGFVTLLLLIFVTSLVWAAMKISRLLPKVAR